MTKSAFTFAGLVAVACIACAGSTRSERASSGRSDAEHGATAQQGANGGTASPVTGQAAQGSTAAEAGQGSTAQAGQGSTAQTAQGSAAGAAPKDIEGRVELIDRAGNVMLAGSESAGRAFDRLKVDSRTEIKVNGEKATLNEVNEGDEVRASCSGSGDTLHVDRLEVRSQNQ